MNTRAGQLPQELVTALKEHIPLHIVCDYLKAHKKSTARSWDEIFGRNSTEQKLFLDLLTEALCFGRKTIFAYNADNIDLDPLDTARFTSVDITRALKTTSAHHTLFRRTKDQRFSSYTFSCQKAAVETYILTKSDLTNDARQRLWTPESEIKLRTQTLVTVFDSLIYDAHNKILFVIIDSSRYNFEESEFDRQADFINTMAKKCPTFSTIKLIDFFSCVDGIYQKKSEGIIHRLAFECNTGAVRDERLKQGQLDLRAELYHTSGKAAIGGDIRPYKVGVTWHPTKYPMLSSEVDLEINGSRKNLHQQGGIYSCDVRSIGTFKELCFALDRVVLYASF